MTHAAAHGLFLAAAVAPVHGDPVRHTLAPGGDGRGVSDLDSRGPVTVTRLATAGPPAAEAADALAGRAPAIGLPASIRTARRSNLTGLGTYMWEICVPCAARPFQLVSRSCSAIDASRDRMQHESLPWPVTTVPAAIKPRLPARPPREQQTSPGLSFGLTLVRGCSSASAEQRTSPGLSLGLTPVRGCSPMTAEACAYEFTGPAVARETDRTNRNRPGWGRSLELTSVSPFSACRLVCDVVLSDAWLRGNRTSVRQRTMAKSVIYVGESSRNPTLRDAVFTGRLVSN